ncbi:MAG: hypothetical protein ACRDJP_15200, partial [Actinomycetota bacterium]
MTEDFFGSPPPPPEPEPEEEESPPKPWYGPPENVLGGTVALDLVLATTDEVAVAITSVTAYPEGVSLP